MSRSRMDRRSFLNLLAGSAAAGAGWSAHGRIHPDAPSVAERVAVDDVFTVRVPLVSGRAPQAAVQPGGGVRLELLLPPGPALELGFRLPPMLRPTQSQARVLDPFGEQIDAFDSDKLVPEANRPLAVVSAPAFGEPAWRLALDLAVDADADAGAVGEVQPVFGSRVLTGAPVQVRVVDSELSPYGAEVAPRSRSGDDAKRLLYPWATGGSDTPTFNAFTDAKEGPTVYQPQFVELRASGAPETAPWHTTGLVYPGDRVTARMLVYNTAKVTLNGEHFDGPGVAHHVFMALYIPTDAGPSTRHQIAGRVYCQEASPRQILAMAQVHAEEPVGIELDPASADPAASPGTARSWLAAELWQWLLRSESRGYTADTLRIPSEVEPDRESAKRWPAGYKRTYSADFLVKSPPEAEPLPGATPSAAGVRA